jgi:beta-glucosidase
MADSKYQPVPHHDTLDSPVVSTEQQSSLTPHHRPKRHQLNPTDVSDLSSQEDTDTENDIMDLDEEEGADETVMAPLNRKNSRRQTSKRRSTNSKFRRRLALLKKSIVRHRLALVAAAGLIFIFLPLIAYQRSIRSFFWADQVYVCLSVLVYLLREY